jgi:hypothetical protein
MRPASAHCWELRADVCLHPSDAARRASSSEATTLNGLQSAGLEAIQRHSPELLAPLIEGHGEPAPLALPRQQRDTTELATPPDWWDR